MGLPLIGFSNLADTSVYGDGAWVPTLPLENLRTRQMGEVARSASVDLFATRFTFDIGGSGSLVRVVGLLNHNLKLNAKYRLSGSKDPSFSVIGYDTGWQSVWPSVYTPDQVEWEAENFWFGIYTLSEIEGYPSHLIIPLGAAYLLRYWKFEIDDQSNPDGYVEVGRLFVGDGWQPANSIAYNCSIAWEDPTTITEALSGSEYFDPKSAYRVARILTHFMSDDEAYSKAFEIQRKSGTWKEVIYIHDVDDTSLSLRRRFPGRLRSIGPIENPYTNANQSNWEIKEALP